MQDLIAGQIDLMFDQASHSLLPRARLNNICSCRVTAVSNDKPRLTPHCIAVAGDYDGLAYLCRLKRPIVHE
jgi:hypothetical protein